jgi:polar amino acid transport system substrate-binding protein
MKKILSLILCLAMAFTMSIALTGCNEDKILVFTNAEFAPYEYVSGDDIVGVDIEIANAIGKKLGKKIEIINLDFDALTPQLSKLKDNEIILAGMTITDARTAVADFSDPYATSIQYIIYDNTKTEPLDTIAKLEGKTVGVQMSTTGDYIMSDFSVAEGLFDLTVKQYSSAQVASQVLLKGEIDAVIVDKLPAEMIAGNYTKLTAVAASYIVEEENIFATESYGVAVKKGNTELMKSINEVIKELTDDGKIEEWTNIYSGIKDSDVPYGLIYGVIGGVLLIAAGIVVFVVLKKKKAKKED